MKYVIKNCPAGFYEFINDEQKCFLKDRKCKHIPDCLIKRIVELCGKYHKIEIGKENPMVAINYLSSDILKLLDIDEVE